MKEELYNKIVAFLKEKYPTDYQEIVKEGFTANVFYQKPHYNYTPFEVKDIGVDIKEGGYKGIELLEKIQKKYPHLQKNYISVIYDKEKDKISISEFIVGWGWGANKNRFYPLKNRIPLLCYSKNIYSFTYRKKPRLMKPVSNSNKMAFEWQSEIEKMMMGIDYTPQLNFVARHYVGTKDNFDVLEKMNPTIKVPKALRIFGVKEVQQLYAVLKNPNEVQRVCQYLSSMDYKYANGNLVPKEEPKGSVIRKESIDPLFRAEPKLTFYQILTLVMKLEVKDYWLVRDYMNDLEKLGKKFSLKMTSKIRMENEHRQMSKEIMLLGVKEIKTHQIYIEQMKDFPIPNAEIITDKARLLFESQSQDHCVATYHHFINSGSCCIISFPYGGKQWTLQLSKAGSMFTCTQLQGLRNREAIPPELLKILRDHYSVYVSDYREKEIKKAREEITRELVGDNLPF